MPSQGRSPKSRVLVVDDHIEMAQVLAEQLGDAGYVVDVASGGAQALLRARASPPDVVITDLRIEHALLPGERRLVTESRATADQGIVTDLMGGDFKRYHRVWKLQPAKEGKETYADFELKVAIDSIVPDWLVALATRRELEAHFRIVKEKARARAAKPEK